MQETSGVAGWSNGRLCLASIFFKFLVLISACSQHLNCTELTSTSRPNYTTRSLVASILVDFLCGETRTVCARPVLKTCISMRLFTVQFSLHAVNTPLVFFRSYYAASHKCGLLLCHKLHMVHVSAHTVESIQKWQNR